MLPFQYVIFDRSLTHSLRPTDWLFMVKELEIILRP
jgi:hypothetical protein